MKDALSKKIAPTHLGRNIRFLRKLKHLSQAKLGEQVGATRSQMASYESGAIEPKLKILLSISLFFDVVLEELLTRDLAEDADFFRHDEETRKRRPEVLHDIRDLIIKTQDMESILEGYKTYYTMRTLLKDEKEILPLINNLFDLMASMIDANWAFIRTVVDEE